MSDLTGSVFGRLTVVRLAEQKRGHFIWECRCECGKRRNVYSHNLRTGNTQSCGCQKAEKAAATCLSRTTHGDNRRDEYCPEYKAWAEMKQRCLNPDNQAYENYGGRGITITKRWMSYENFLADMGRKPSPELTLDRKNNDSGYSKRNCRWATRKQQANNRRDRYRSSGE